MVQTQEQVLPRLAKWGWGVLLAIGAVLALNGAGLYFFIAESQIVQTAAILTTGTGLLALGLAWEGFRHGSRWAWRVLWALVLTLAALGVHILVGGEQVVGIWYLALAGAALVGQLLAGKLQT